MRETVRKLAGYFPTAIASGRCRDKVYSFVRLAKLYYAGSHGMDIKGPSKGSKYKKRAVTMFLLIFYYSVSHVSSVDTLKQGNRLNSSRQLVSADGVFTLGFYSLENTNNSYLGVWFTDDSYGPIWLGNRDKPITDNSGVLTISSTRKLIINSSGGDPIELYANENGINIMATLLNSGNFVVKEIDINGSGDRVLWQSFDYPTDTLLPGMKLGINHRTQRNWSITSWFSQNNPVAGAFTLEWDPSRHRLIIRRRGVAYWTSGELTDYIDEDRPDLKLKKFENIGYKYDPYNSIYNFVNVTNDDEDYMSYLFEIDPVLTTDELKISAWKLDSEGFMYDHNRMVIVDVQRCYGYNTQEGCELWGQPKCRNHKETFALRSGHFIPTSDSYILDDNSSRLTESDCRGYCWNDCECVGYTAGTESGCVYWKGKNLTFVQSLDGSEVRKHILISEPAKKGKKKMIWITIAVVTTVVLLLLGSSWFMMHKIIERKLEEELEKMITLEKYTGTDELDNDGRKGHNHIPVVSVYGYVDAHASRLAARNSISSENKPGEGGFGPVYEGCKHSILLRCEL